MTPPSILSPKVAASGPQNSSFVHRLSDRDSAARSAVMCSAPWHIYLVSECHLSHMFTWDHLQQPSQTVILWEVQIASLKRLGPCVAWRAFLPIPQHQRSPSRKVDLGGAQGASTIPIHPIGFPRAHPRLEDKTKLKC